MSRYIDWLNDFVTINIDAGIYLPVDADEFLAEYRRELKGLIDLISIDIYIENKERENLVRALNNKTSLFPNLYVTIKAHKEGNPVRAIVAAQHSHTVKLQDCITVLSWTACHIAYKNFIELNIPAFVKSDGRNAFI